MTTQRPLFGAIEAGGTKFVLATGNAEGSILARHTIPTRRPEQTLAEAAEWFAAQQPIAALGIGSFGPIDLSPASPTWGYILDTPKPGWSQCNLAGYFAQKIGVPVAFDTDVNAAALGEHLYGAGQGKNSLAYITVGTGIGGGLVIDGQPVHGTAHPEMGHMFPRRPATDQDFGGVCRFHGDCLEGLASGPAIFTRWKTELSALPHDHEAHAIIAGYLAQLCHTLFALTSVETVVLGGGVMQTAGLHDYVREKAAAIDSGYLPGQARHMIVAPGLDNNAGIIGALAMAARELIPHI